VTGDTASYTLRKVFCGALEYEIDSLRCVKARNVQGRSQSMNPHGLTSMVMDLTNPMVQPYHVLSSGVQISTLTTGHDVLVAGGFCGEYGIVNLRPRRTLGKHECASIVN
jgi:hypothetical protein